MDVATATLVQEVVRRESLSLLSYVGDAFPWAAKGRAAALLQLRQIVADHNKAIGTLRRLLDAHRAVPASIGSFPSGFTTINFLGLDYVLARLIESERKLITRLESDLARTNDSEARAALEHFLAGKRDLLARLLALATAPSSIAPTPAAS